MGSIRALVIAVIAFFLLEPMVRILLREVRKPVVILAHDGSSSLLAVGDTVAFRDRYARSLQELADKLSDRYEVRSFTYGSAVRDGLFFAQNEARTDIDQLFRAIYDRFAGPDLGAVIIDGDGIYNRGRDPRAAAERLGVPVFTIALGDTTVRPDLMLRDVEHNKVTYLGNEFPLLVRVQAHHLRGKSTRVSVIHAGKEVAGKDVSIDADPWITEVPLMVKADAVGTQRYAVRLRAAEGEVTLENNERSFYLEVLDDRRKVLLLAQAPHPDVAAIHRSLALLEGYEVDVATAATFQGDIGKYDVVVLHQLPSVQAPISGSLQQIDRKNIPTWTILGMGSDIRQAGSMANGVDIQGGRASFTNAQAVVQPDFALFTLDPEDIQAIERFPPLQVPFAQYALGRSAVAWMDQKIGSVRTPFPLFAFQANTERRTAITVGEGLWRWKLADQQQNNTHAHFDKLVAKTIEFLALKEDKSRFRVKLPGRFEQNEKMTLDAELYNASMEQVNSPEAEITLKDEDGKEFAYTFSRNDPGYRLEAGILPAGRYSYVAGVTLDGERLTAKGEFVVEPLQLERLNTVADMALWSGISAKTDGVMVDRSELDRIVEVMQERPQMTPRSYSHASYSDLIGLRWIFFALLALLTAEWALRRRNGAY